jgi:uncharacterized OsmC-like protein
MQIVLESDSRIRLAAAGPGFEIVPEGSALSPFHMLAAALATCTTSTLAGWAEGAGVSMEGLEIDVAWTLAPEPPMRVLTMDLTLRWAGLPASRAQAAVRVAHLCPIHDTLSRAAEVTTRVEAEG